MTTVSLNQLLSVCYLTIIAMNIKVQRETELTARKGTIHPITESRYKGSIKAAEKISQWTGPGEEATRDRLSLR